MVKLDNIARALRIALERYAEGIYYRQSDAVLRAHIEALLENLPNAVPEPGDVEEVVRRLLKVHAARHLIGSPALFLLVKLEVYVEGRAVLYVLTQPPLRSPRNSRSSTQGQHGLSRTPVPEEGSGVRLGH